MQNNLFLYPNLVKVRKERMTQKELAAQIGISQQEISRYESGEVKAPINYIIDLAECCGVSVDYILGKNEAPPLNPDTAELVKKYSKLNKENKIRAKERIDTLLELQKKNGV